MAPRSLFSVSSWSPERRHYFARWPPLFRSILLNCGRDNTSLRPTRRFETNPHSRFPIICSFILTPLPTYQWYTGSITSLAAERQFRLNSEGSILHPLRYALNPARHVTSRPVTKVSPNCFRFANVVIDYARDG